MENRSWGADCLLGVRLKKDKEKRVHVMGWSPPRTGTICVYGMDEEEA